MHFNLLFSLLTVVFNFEFIGAYSENCKDEICVKDKWPSVPTNRTNNTLLNKTHYKTLNNVENRSEVQITHLGSVIEALNDTPIPIDFNFETESYKNRQTTTFFEVTENVTDLLNTLDKENELANDYTLETKEAANNTPQYIAKTTPKTIFTSFSDYSIFFNVSDYNGICLCDLSVNECDINCCCDHECNINHWKIFTQCDETYSNYQFFNCYKNNFMLKNNLHSKVMHSENGLLCVAKSNLKSGFVFQNLGILTNLKNFRKILSKNMYIFEYKEMPHYKFEVKGYKAGSIVWIIHDGIMKPFAIPEQTIGSTCISEKPVRYLSEHVVECSYINNNARCVDLDTKNLIRYLKDIMVIANPQLLNQSVKHESLKVCQNKACLSTEVSICREFKNCSKLSSGWTQFQEKVNCDEFVSKIQYQIWHNGSEGIIKFDVFIFMKNLPLRNINPVKVLRITEVKFFWANSFKNSRPFKKSGNPGYLTGKPVLTSKKNLGENETGIKRDTLELPLILSERGLDVLGSNNGFCSSQNRIPISFQENAHYSCIIKLSKNDFGKKNCIELQKKIFNLLLGDDLTNITSETYFNKFVATFGNSRLEDIDDWVQVLIDLAPVVSSQVDFKFEYDSLTCRNIISDVTINIAYSSVGSFLSPQAKILGVSYQFGKHKDFNFYCDNFQCESSFHDQFFRLSSIVNFIDVTEPAIDVFAEQLGLKIRLPHDFFYPFFSKAPTLQSLSKFVSGLFFLTLLKFK